MNQLKGPYFLSLIYIGFLVLSCKGPVKKEEEATVLKQTPFAPLTDSIRQSKPADQAELYFRRAELLSRNNLHELAAEDYKKSWNLHPDEATGLRYASTLAILGRTGEAAKLLQDCRERFPDNDNFSNMLGDAYVQAGKMKEALNLYDTLLQKDSLNFEAWYERGLLLEKAKDTAGALTALQKAFAIQPVNTYALELAHLYAENRNSKALELCDEVLRKDLAHELLDPFFIKGIYYSNIGSYKLAVVQFDSCIRRDWKFTDAHLEKGIALFKQKNYEAALKTFRMSVEVSNTYPDGYYWIGRCYEVAGSKEDAISYYQRALSLDKDFTEADEAIKRLK
ncbi:MAG TPA: tetratricopeptide repeat protein [Puia sp.]|nr:tetratricopeptide repeat protein [Puia sp.]